MSGESERRSRPPDVFGKAITSRTVCEPVSMATSLSNPEILETGVRFIALWWLSFLCPYRTCTAYLALFLHVGVPRTPEPLTDASEETRLHVESHGVRSAARQADEFESIHRPLPGHCIRGHSADREPTDTLTVKAVTVGTTYIYDK